MYVFLFKVYIKGKYDNNFDFNFNALSYEYSIDLLYLIYFNIHKVKFYV